nr:RNA-directed DNA polymerase, eukaryota [Tanacetum cinerariifolium]
DVKFMWGNYNYNYVYSEAVGNSGGILCVWEGNVFKKDYATISDNFIAIYGTWLPSNSKILFVAIYAPQQASCKRVLWEYVSTLIGSWNGETIILGDFNEVRSIDERRGSCFNPSSARVFDHFISSSSLVDVKLDGLEGFDAMVEQTWCSFSHSDVNRMIRFKKKLQDLKTIIRCWVKDKRMHRSGEKNSIKNELSDIDKEVDRGVVYDTNLFRHLELQRKLHDINQMEAKDSFQKSKIKWAIEGDENSKFFHGIINKKRSQLAIRGVFDHGLWCTDPGNVKEILANRLALVIADLVSDTQSAFVANRQILDGPFILNEILHWCKRKKKQAMFFKVDFAKAYDSVCWDYLLDVLEAFEFGHTWCGFVQGDPLSPYLFILIMESLHISFSRAVDEGEWSDANLKGIVNILQCFFLALGLKINIHKSQVFGVGIPCSIVIRPVRAGFEHQQMVDLNSFLESVSLSQSHDRWFCDLTGDEEFRVKE